jgi:chloramphenicol 3-O phosphotransferase
VIILLNGPSSSGKTTLARALQEVWAAPLAYLSLDSVIGQLPFKFTGFGAHAEAGFALCRGADTTGELTWFRPGAHGYQLNALAARSVSSMAAAGFDVVVDYVFVDQQMLQPFVEALTDVPVLFVGLVCRTETLTARNEQRTDRAAGLSRAQLSDVHFCRRLYDLEVDSSRHPAAEMANQILNHLQAGNVSAGIGTSRAQHNQGEHS